MGKMGKIRAVNFDGSVKNGGFLACGYAAAGRLFALIAYFFIL